MTKAKGSSKKTQLTVDEKRIIALLGRETAEKDDGEPDSNYVEPLPVTLEEAKRSSLCLSEFVGDNIALFSEEGRDRTLLQIVDKIQSLTPEMLKI